MIVTDMQLVSGYYRSNQSPQLVPQVVALIAEGWQPWGTVLVYEPAFNITQMMVKGASAPITDYTITHGYTDVRTPQIAVPPGGGWSPLGSPQWINSNYYIMNWVRGL